ncbi:MAG: hypothetical protein ACFFD2_26990 [Promethearchaeota archaeon]
MVEATKEFIEEKPSLIWSIFLVGGANLMILSALFVPTIYFWHVLGAIGLLNLLLVVLVFVGLKRHQKLKDKDLSATTFSRKMFNIISGLIFASFILIFSPFLVLFILLGVDFAFGFHEIIYVVFKSKTYYTNAFIALGRQSAPFKPYLASIMALLGFTIVLGFQTLLFNFNAVNFLPLKYEFVCVIVYVAIILIWGIGDTAAYFAGTHYGRHKLPYNRGKSWEGFFANMTVGIVIGLIFFSPVVFPFMNTFWWIFLSLIGGITCAFSESINLHLDDNFVTVTITGIIIGSLMVIA